MIVITGPSASGKTVAAKLLEKNYGFKKAITTTSRTPRDGEVDGVDYFFISKEEFENRLQKGMFVEYTLYNNNYYGCGKDQVSDNKVIVTDLNGLHSFQALNVSSLVTFLLICNDDVRLARMIDRGDKHEKILERMQNDKYDFSMDKVGKIDFIIDTNLQEKEETAAIIYNLYKEKINN